MFKRQGYGLCCVRHTRVLKPARTGIQRVMKYRLRQALNTHVNHACPDFALVAVLTPSIPVTKMLKCRCRTTRVFRIAVKYKQRTRAEYATT